MALSDDLSGAKATIPAIHSYRILLVLALVAEVLVLSDIYEPWFPVDHKLLWSEWIVANSSMLLRMVVASIGVLVLVLWPRFRSIANELSLTRHHYWWLWTVGHLAALALFSLLIVILMNDARALTVASPGLYTGWVAAALATAVLWLGAFAPPGFWISLIRRERLAFGLAALAGVVAWLGGQLTQQLWETLAAATFWLARHILSLVIPSIVSLADEKILGTAAFQIQIAPECSGYEGISLVTVFLAVYLWWFRNEMRFPNAFMLFPLGILAIYVANALRLSALILVGTYYSPEVAVGGFHSQAGWIAFTAVALGVVAFARHMSFLRRGPAARSAEGAANPASALLVPFFCMTGAVMITAAFSAGFNILYPVPVVITLVALRHYRRAYAGLGWRGSWFAVFAGCVVFAVWILLEPDTAAKGQQLEERIAGLSSGVAIIWASFRVIGSVIVVPMAEELAFRGYLLRKLVSKDFAKVAVGHFSWFSFLFTSVLFGLLHDRWVAGTVAGMIFALALYRRRQFADALLAHVTANALIAAYVLLFGQWGLWT